MGSRGGTTDQEPDYCHVTVTLDVLVVSRHTLVAKTMSAALSSHDRIGRAVEVAPGREAVVQCGRLQPTCIVVDAESAGDDALTLLPDLLRAAPGARALVVSHTNDDAVVSQAIEAGATGVLTVDASFGELVAAVLAVAEGRSVLSGRHLTDLVRRLSAPIEAAETPGGQWNLTQREWDVLQRIGAGKSTRVIAAELEISVNTVRTHVQRVLSKLGVHTKLEAAAYVARHRAAVGDGLD